MADVDECLAKALAGTSTWSCARFFSPHPFPRAGELLPEADLKDICNRVKELLVFESNVVHIKAPCTVVGDVHGLERGGKRSANLLAHCALGL